MFGASVIGYNVFMKIAEITGNGACPARTELNLAATSQVRLYADTYQIVLGCTLPYKHDLHEHWSADDLFVAAWYS